MYGYTSHIPRLQELCDWLNSIPNSWNGTLSYYHYNSNYTPASADKLLQVNSSGSAEFTPTGVYYTNTAASKFIKEEEVRTYRFRFGYKYYDYGTVSGLSLNYNGGTYYGSGGCSSGDESIGNPIFIDHITMNDSSRTPNYATLSDFEASSQIYLYNSGNGILPKVYVPAVNCLAENRSGYVKHKPTNTTINYTWTVGVNEKLIYITPVFTTRPNGIDIVRLYAMIWMTNYGDMYDPNNWDVLDWEYSGTYPNHYRASYISAYSGPIHSCSTENSGWPSLTMYLLLSIIAIDSLGRVYDTGCHGNPLMGANVNNIYNYDWVRADPDYAILFTIFNPSYGAVTATGEYGCSVDDLYCIFGIEGGGVLLMNTISQNIENTWSDAALDEWATVRGYSGYSLL